MKKLISLALVLFASTAFAAKVGTQAPDFSGKTMDGKTTYHLADLKGKYVVLEWHNQGCPFVKKHYDSGNMQKLQAEWTKQGVVWLSVISSAQGKQGFITDAQEETYLRDKKAVPTAVLADASGAIAKLYGAKTTPDMFVIDPQGTLIYNGAIDDHATTDQADIAKSRNYVDSALTEAMAGKPVTVSSTTPYGCSVKY